MNTDKKGSSSNFVKTPNILGLSTLIAPISATASQKLTESLKKETKIREIRVNPCPKDLVAAGGCTMDEREILAREWFDRGDNHLRAEFSREECEQAIRIAGAIKEAVLNELGWV